MDLYLLLQNFYSINTNYLFIIFLGFTLPSVFVFMQKRKGKGKRKLPPGPTRLPLIGNLHQLSDLPHRSLHQLSIKHGPLMFLQLGSIPTLVISSADMVREIFKTHDVVFSARPVLYAAKRLTYECRDIAFAPYGEYWREIWKIGVSELLSAKKVQSFQTVREEEVALMVDSIASSHVPVDLSKLLLHFINNIVCRVAFGRRYEETDNGSEKFQKLPLETQELLAGFSLADFFPWLGWIHKFDGLDAKIARSFRKWDKFYDEVIEEHLDFRRPETELEDLVDVMLRVQRDPTQKITLTRNHIKGVLTDIFIAGTDTVSATLVWTMTELIKNPTQMKKVQDEVRQVVGKQELVAERDLPEFYYLKLVVKESLRLHPPAPLLGPRETTENCTVQEYEIPAKTRVFINAKSIMSEPRSWRNPEEFCPERFGSHPVDFKDYEFLPFGVGRKGCPGANFALVLIEVVLANLLHCFDWELPQGVEREDVDMKEAPGLTMHKKIPLCLIARSAEYEWINKISIDEGIENDATQDPHWNIYEDWP